MKQFAAILALAATLTASAATISPDQALQRYLDQQGDISTAATSSSSLTLTYTLNAPASANPAIYVFNREANSGCIFIAANDNVTPLLGYIDSGSFDYATAAPEMLYHLSTLAKQIENAPEGALKSATASSDDFAAISPLCKTKWNQSAPYYNMTPTINGSQSATGCVATAMAQVMKYHNWPPKGQGSITYTDGYNNTYSTDFSTSTYDWDNMLNSYTGGYTEAQANAVALLMKDCGYSVNMNYDPSESGAAGSFVAQALIDYFDYAADTTVSYRMFYTLAEWNALIYNQFVNYGPVLICGANDTGGHAFVADGYSSNGFFHINWGWGGLSDGYFLLSALDPADQGIGGSAAGYADDQLAIINIHKNDGTVVTPTFKVGLLSGILFEQPVTLGSEYIYLNASIYNFGQTEANFTSALAIVSDATGNVAYWGGYKFSEFLPGYYTTSAMPFVTNKLADGTYTVYPVAIDSDSNITPLLIPSTYSQSVTMTVASGIATFSEDEPLIRVTDIALKSAVVGVGDATTRFTITVTNVSDKEFYGNITSEAYAVTDTEAIQLASEDTAYEGSNFNLTLAAGESTTIDYSTSYGFTTTGNYVIYFTTSDGTHISDGFNVTVEDVESGTVTATSFAFTDGNSTGVDWNDLNITATLLCSGGYYDGAPRLYIFPISGGSSLASLTTSSVQLTDGQSATVTYKGSFAAAEPNTAYFAMLYDNGNWISNYLDFTTATTTAIETIQADDASAVTELYNLQGQRVTNPTPGIYLLRRGSTVSKIAIK